jgi:hypothetical protein
MQKGDTFGTFTIIDDNFHFEGRKYVLVKCKCGRIIKQRKSHWGKTHSCKQCTNSTHYPETRKSSALHYKGLRKVFLTKLYNPHNLNRGENKVLKVELTIEQLFNKLVEQDFKCALSKIPLNVLHIDPTASNASIDRIDSLGDYTINNIQWVHKDINRIKNNFTQHRFIELCKLVSNNF